MQEAWARNLWQGAAGHQQGDWTEGGFYLFTFTFHHTISLFNHQINKETGQRVSSLFSHFTFTCQTKVFHFTIQTTKSTRRLDRGWVLSFTFHSKDFIFKQAYQQGKKMISLIFCHENRERAKFVMFSSIKIIRSYFKCPITKIAFNRNYFIFKQANQQGEWTGGETKKKHFSFHYQLTLAKSWGGDTVHFLQYSEDGQCNARVLTSVIVGADMKSNALQYSEVGQC